jgi:hypothetical protein
MMLSNFPAAGKKFIRKLFTPFTAIHKARIFPWARERKIIMLRPTETKL